MNGTDKDPYKEKSGGIRLRFLNYLMMAVTLILSVLLFVSTYSTTGGYGDMREVTNGYIKWQKSAYEMQVASDYLTEQARSFAITGDRTYMDNYFEEAKVVRRRENSLAVLKESFETTEAYEALERAMNESVELMDREYYSMRLAAEAKGLKADSLPEEIKNVRLSEADGALPAEKKTELAREMVFDNIYSQKKEAISDNMQNCLDSLVRETETMQTEASDRLQTLLIRQQILIVLLVLSMIIVVILTSAQVIGPILKAVPFIRAEKPLPVKGAFEIRFLAKTYNRMYELNKESKENLLYAASHDKLTGLFNRRGYDAFVRTTYTAGAALLMIDIDKFKSINDVNGHDAGDRVLKKVASLLKGEFRSKDCVSRIGGDEFAIVMTDVRPEYKELIKRKIDAVNVRLGEAEEGIPISSISVGVAFGNVTGSSAALFKIADKALYSVKTAGGCGCAFAESGE